MRSPRNSLEPSCASFFSLVTAILLVAAVAGPAAAAKPTGKKLPPTVVKVVASGGEQGDFLTVNATIRAPKGTGVSGTAVVHFASGDVSFDLAQVRKSLTLRARTAVGAEEATGPVMIDVTLYAGGLAFVRTVSVDIVEPAPVL